MPAKNQTKKKRRKARNKIVLSPEEKIKKRKKAKLNIDLKSFFKGMGFEFLSTNGIEKRFNNIPGELDGIFIFENIIIITEQTISSDNDHLRKKHDYYQAILNDKTAFLEWIKPAYKDKFKKFETYTNPRYSIFYLYVSESNLDEEVRLRYPDIKYFGPKALKYFLRVSRCIKFSSRNEFFRFLGLKLNDIGNSNSSSSERHIDSAVIMPESSSGYPEGMHVVSFVMKAKELLDCAYVFRKDSWENAIGRYYQRLVDKNKIERIRQYLAKEGKTFIDNIIVVLPESTTFSKKSKPNEFINVNTISTISNVQIRIPYEINSIGIIDGQHRVFGHYEGNDILESKIAIHRNKRHLFVTGIFYESGKFEENQKRSFESGLFLTMNNTQSKVRTDLLQYIETLKSPMSPLGVAGNVIMKLNDRSPFLDLFVLSPLDKSGIRTPTIVKFGLQSIVEISNKKGSLFYYWKGVNKRKLLAGNMIDVAYNAYIEFCVSNLSIYFSAIKANFTAKWNLDKDNRLLTSTAIVAFLRSFGKSLEIYQKVEDFAFYKNKISQLTLTFTKQSFSKYGSSHWPTLSAKIDAECWT